MAEYRITLPLCTMYSISEYGSMIADKARMDPYAYALKAVVKPGSVVLDIGVATGIHALLACKFGARKVYGVEPNDAIHLARELAQANNYGDRIEFIQGLSTDITLPERADVIVSDLRGILPLFGQHIPSIVDARQRHLAPGGTLIPERDTLWVALVECHSIYRYLNKPWDWPYGLNMEAARQIALNNWTQDDTESFEPADLLTEAQVWTVLDYGTIEDANVTDSVVVQTVLRKGTAHGWLVWFDTELAEGIGFSNAPEARKPTDVYGRALFPLLEPVPVSRGDVVSLDLRAILEDDEYTWAWHTQVHAGEELQRIKAEFQQSTAYGCDSS